VTHTRRPLLKRVTLWTAAAVLLLTSYVLGAPFVILISGRHCPRALPFLDAAYAPLHVYVNTQQIPGSSSYNDYALWCQRQFQDDLIYDSPVILPETAVPER
jgi:hypothetical protein